MKRLQVRQAGAARNGSSGAAHSGAAGPIAGPEAAVPAAVLLPADCTLREIGALHQCLRGAAHELPLDGSAVRRIDTAGVQLLVAFMRERKAANRAVRWQAASSALSQTVLSLGLSAALNLPVA